MLAQKKIGQMDFIIQWFCGIYILINISMVLNMLHKLMLVPTLYKYALANTKFFLYFKSSKK